MSSDNQMESLVSFGIIPRADLFDLGADAIDEVLSNLGNNTDFGNFGSESSSPGYCTDDSNSSTVGFEQREAENRYPATETVATTSGSAINVKSDNQMEFVALVEMNPPAELVDLGADVTDKVLSNLTNTADFGNVNFESNWTDSSNSNFEKENLYPHLHGEVPSTSGSANTFASYSNWPSSGTVDKQTQFFNILEGMRSVRNIFDDWEYAGGRKPAAQPLAPKDVQMPIKNQANHVPIGNLAAAGNDQQMVFVNENNVEENGGEVLYRENNKYSPYESVSRAPVIRIKKESKDCVEDHKIVKKRYKKSTQMRAPRNADRVPVAYEFLAGLALINGASYVREVYGFVVVNMPNCRTRGPKETWKNSIREQLSKDFSGFFSKEEAVGGRKKINRYAMTDDQKQQFYIRYPVAYAKPSEFLWNPDDFEAIYTGRKGLPTTAEIQAAMKRDLPEILLPQQYIHEEPALLYEMLPEYVEEQHCDESVPSYECMPEYIEEKLLEMFDPAQISLF